MGKHAAWTQVWAYSAEQMAIALENKSGDEYKQGLLDALRAVARLESAEIDPMQMQNVLDGLPTGWTPEMRGSYMAGFQTMYGNLAETLASSSLKKLSVGFHDQNVVYEGRVTESSPWGGCVTYPGVPESSKPLSGDRDRVRVN